MRDKNSGKMIFTLRSHYKISMEKLAKGICSITSLSRFESCERIPDKLLLDALLQRLGKSSDKLEAIMTVADYRLFVHREKIEECIITEDYKTAKELLSEYEKKHKAKEPVHMQYILKMKAILCELEERDIENSRRYIEEAIRVSMPEGEKSAIENALLSKSEIQLILMKIYYNDSEEEDEETLVLLKQLNHYVRCHYTDEEELVKIYAKIIRVEAKILLRKENYEKAVEVCESALALLRNNGVLLDFDEILSMLIEGLEHTKDQSRKLQKMKKWETVLSGLYKEYEILRPKGSMKLLMENSQCEIFLLNEIIKKGRKAKGLSQEALSEGICTPENLSAIESGRRAPNIKNYGKILEKLGVYKGYYNSFLSDEKFDAQEYRRECNKLMYFKKYEQVDPLLQKIEKVVNTSIPINHQYLLFNQTMLQYYKKELSETEALNNAISALNLTMEYNDGNFRTDSSPSQEEAKILNFIGIIYNFLGEKETAVKLYKKVLQSYEASKVPVKEHYVGNSLIMGNLCMLLEEINEIEESMEVAVKGIKQDLRCGRITMLPVFLTNQACCLEKKKEQDKKVCKQYFEQAFYLSAIVNNDYFKNTIKKHYLAHYGDAEEIID